MLREDKDLELLTACDKPRLYNLPCAGHFTQKAKTLDHRLQQDITKSERG